MNAKELAEKIVTELFYWRRSKGKPVNHLKGAIESLLEEALREAELNILNTTCRMCYRMENNPKQYEGHLCEHLKYAILSQIQKDAEKIESWEEIYPSYGQILKRLANEIRAQLLTDEGQQVKE